MPCRRHRSSHMLSNGAPLNGNRHLGVVSVSGFKRVPLPAAKRNAFTGLSLGAFQWPGWGGRRIGGGGVCTCGGRGLIPNQAPAQPAGMVSIQKWIVYQDLSPLRLKFEPHLRQVV